MRVGTPQLIAAVTGLLGLGLVMLYSASAARGLLENGQSAHYVWRQLEGLALGLLAAAIAARIPLTWLRRWAPGLWLLGIASIALSLTSLGVSWNGARRWVSVGGFAFQPLEVSKLGVVLAVAWWCAGRERRLGDPRVSILTPALLCGVPAALLLLQPDYGGAMMLVLFTFVLIFAAGARISQLAAAALVAIPIAISLAFSRAYRVSRLGSFVDPWGDPLGDGYQLVQSLLAFGAGGITGGGLGAGEQKLGYLPEAHTDFILSVVGEELGLLGVGGVLICFALVGLAAIAIASRSRDLFGLLTALGASLLLWLQGVISAGVAMGVLPTTGTTLPLFSYGRSSLVVSLVAVGLVLNVARPKPGRRGWR